MVEAVLFDLYDTLIHLPRNVNPYIQLYRKVDAQSRIRESMTANASSLLIFCQYLGVKPPSDIIHLQAELDADILSCATFDDAIPTLKMVRERRIRIAIVSNVATPYIAPFYRLGLNDYVDSVVFSCDIGIAKPDPRIYEAALASLNVEAKNTIMVGDSQCSDVDGPSALGIKGILLDRGRKQSKSGILHTLNGITAYLDG